MTKPKDVGHESINPPVNADDNDRDAQKRQHDQHAAHRAHVNADHADKAKSGRKTVSESKTVADQQTKAEREAAAETADNAGEEPPSSDQAKTIADSAPELPEINPNVQKARELAYERADLAIVNNSGTNTALTVPKDPTVDDIEAFRGLRLGDDPNFEVIYRNAYRERITERLGHV